MRPKKVKMINRKGFTFPEITVVITILVMLAGLILGNLFTLRQTATLTTITDTLIADLKQQQIKAMVGDTEGRATADSYGIYFEPNKYTLFHGATYIAGDPDNFEVEIDETAIFTSVLFAGSQIVFAAQSGEVVGLTAGADELTIKDPNSALQKKITVNRYGAVTSID